MNSALLNELLLLGLAVAALVGKFIFERVATRSEERKALAAARAAKHGAEPGVTLAPRP
jgi:hypothetical protein